LTCVLRSGAAGGVCDIADYGLTPSGKSCVGECATPADCCEMPPPGIAFVHPTTGLSETARSCADIVAALGGGTAACSPAPSATSLLNPLCFFYATYCDCAPNLWACEKNLCTYAAPCQVANGVDMLSGCPRVVRTGRAHPNCDGVTSQCEISASACTTDASCVGALVAEQDDTCSTNECVCVEGVCYRKCDEELDCSPRYRCDMTKKVCVQDTACNAHAECAPLLNDAAARCEMGKCVKPCTIDHQCGGSGLTGGGTFEESVCSDKGICEPLGCSSHNDCDTGTARMFCVPETTATVPVYRSAFTD
jgi:hypothetical protein